MKIISPAGPKGFTTVFWTSRAILIPSTNTVFHCGMAERLETPRYFIVCIRTDWKASGSSISRELEKELSEVLENLE